VDWEEIFKIKLARLEHMRKHAVSAETEERLLAGSLFYIVVQGVPAFCGFFVSERLALTVAHNACVEVGANLTAVDAAGHDLTLKVVSVNSNLDVAVLAHVSGARADSAFLHIEPLPELCAGTGGGLVTMGIGLSRERGTPRKLLQQKTEIMSVVHSHIHYIATTWNSDCGAPFLFYDGGVVGMHVSYATAGTGVQSPLPLVVAPAGAGGAGGGGAGGAADGDPRLPGRMRRALVVSIDEVTDALAAAASAAAAAAPAAGTPCT